MIENHDIDEVSLSRTEGSGLTAQPEVSSNASVGTTASSSNTFNNDLTGANIANIANQVLDNARQQATQHIHLSEQKLPLAEAAKEIQNLLKQLEASNPGATEAEKVAHVNDETTPKFKRRVASALKAGSETAIEEFLDNPYVNVGKAIVKGWIKPE